MANLMTVEVVSPEQVLYSGEATMVITRTLGGGEIAFQPGHAAFLGALTENHTRVFLADGTVEDIAVHGGFVEVSNNKVSILSDAAELGSQIDIERARAAKERAEDRLRHEHDAEALSALGRAHARLRAAGDQRLTACIRSVGARHRGVVGDRGGDGRAARRRGRADGGRRPPAGPARGARRAPRRHRGARRRSRTDDGQAAVAARIADPERPIDLVVNNAGFGTNGAFHELDADRLAGEIELNVAALTRLSHAALRRDDPARPRLVAQRVERGQLPAGAAARGVRGHEGVRDEPDREPARGGQAGRRARDRAVPRVDQDRVPAGQQHPAVRRPVPGVRVDEPRGRWPPPACATWWPTRRCRSQACSTGRWRSSRTPSRGPRRNGLSARVRRCVTNWWSDPYRHV